jgi:hypothetical protein
MAQAAAKGDTEIMAELCVAIEDLRAKLSLAPCRVCHERLGRDPLNPTIIFEGELAHQACAEGASLAGALDETPAARTP